MLSLLLLQAVAFFACFADLFPGLSLLGVVAIAILVPGPLFVVFVIGAYWGMTDIWGWPWWIAGTLNLPTTVVWAGCVADVDLDRWQRRRKARAAAKGRNGDDAG